MKIKGFVYLDDIEVILDPDQSAQFNKTETLIELSHNGKIEEYIPIATLRTILMDSLPRKYRCRWCQKEVDIKPCSHCGRM